MISLYTLLFLLFKQISAGQYSSLQRTRSARISRASWGDNSHIAKMRAVNIESTDFQPKR